MKNIAKNQSVPRRRAFTLVELLVVISIIALLAAFTMGGLKSVSKSRKVSAAKAEMEQLKSAIQNYHAKYDVYPPANNFGNPLLSQLYYELSGTVFDGTKFVTLDSSSTIALADVSTAYGVGGFLNCTKGGGEDAAGAKNFLPGLKANQLNYYVTNNGIRTTMVITSVGGPEDNYQPLLAAGLNPFRYVNPGTNNPDGYDLWVQLVIGKETNLVCNWSKTVVKNTTLP